jgi:hypothetical protein
MSPGTDMGAGMGMGMRTVLHKGMRGICRISGDTRGGRPKNRWGNHVDGAIGMLPSRG